MIGWLRVMWAEHGLVTQKKALERAHNAFRLGVDTGTAEAGRMLLAKVNRSE